jgi:hypothetical protein
MNMFRLRKAEIGRIRINGCSALLARGQLGPRPTVGVGEWLPASSVQDDAGGDEAGGLGAEDAVADGDDRGAGSRGGFDFGGVVAALGADEDAVFGKLPEGGVGAEGAQLLFGDERGPGALRMASSGSWAAMGAGGRGHIARRPRR